MVAKVLVQAQDGTPKQIVFGDHAGDFSPTAANDLRHATAGNRTNVELDLASLANGSARQSAKFDFGTDRAPIYAVRGALEIAATPTAGNTVTVYIGYSRSSTAGNGNPANLSGSDAAYAGYSSNLADSLKQLDLIGTFVVTAQATTTIQVALGGSFSPKEQYASIVVVNDAGAALHSDDVEMHVVFDPIVPETQ